jgi:hypothetical protein
MKAFINFFLHCCKGNDEKKNPDSSGLVMDEVERVEKKSELLKKDSFDEPDKEKTPECDVTDIKDGRFLKVKGDRPSIILSMDGSEHHVVLYEDKGMSKKKKSKHKKKRKKQPKN